jgi:hypothetical protein
VPTYAAPPAVMPATAPTSVRTPYANGQKTPGWITPLAVWPDDRGQNVQAHGGGVIRVGDTFWWFGEERSRDNPRDRKVVGCYASADLVHWTRHRPVVDMAAPDGIAAPWVLERPKVFHNAATGKFILYAHVDDRSYGLAHVGVFVSDTVDGQYKFLKSFRPLGQESRDIGAFQDRDGSAYLIFESRPTGGFFIAKLSDDYLDVAERTCFIKAPLEGGAVCHVGDTYYCVGSHMSGWKPNPNLCATATKLSGPWSAFTDIAPPATNTYGSQSAFLLDVRGDKAETVIYVGDQWRPRTQWDSRYLWMPMEIGGGHLRLPPPRPWTIDVKSGVVTFK